MKLYQNKIDVNIEGENLTDELLEEIGDEMDTIVQEAVDRLAETAHKLSTQRNIKLTVYSD